MTGDSANDNLDEWNRRAQRPGLHAVFTTRWSDDECEKVHAEQQRMTLELLGDLREQRVLDIGCGIGRLTRALSALASSVAGVDLSAEMIARARLEVRGGTVEFVQASAAALPFRDHEFDGAVASYVFQHILSDDVFESAIAELSRVLRPGGRLVTVDGIGQRTFQPANSPVTIVRSWSQYSSALERRFTLRERRPLRCVEDDYEVMHWARRNDERGGHP